MNPRTIRRFPTFLLAAWLPFTFSCSQPAPTAAPETAPVPAPDGVRTVVLVSIDTWRRDATGFLGDRQPSPTPFLDTLAAAGWVAGNAVAPVPLTGPSHWSLLTGRWPWRDGYRVNQDLPSRDDAVFLSTVLRDAGWRTGAFVSAAPLDKRFGFDAGFDWYDDRLALTAEPGAAERRGDATVRAALSWARQRSPEDRLFLWVHLFDPHFPYNAPGAAGNPGELGAYLAEVAFADAQVRVLAEGLEALGRPAASALWAVVGDHGEGLGEHGELSHGNLLHGATTRIPLFFAGPGFPAERSDRLASTVDVAATLLARLGLAAVPGDGLDLLDLDLPGPAPERAVPLESLAALRDYGLSPVYGLRLGDWLWERSPEDHLWNLADDPRESVDLAVERPDKVAEMGQVRRRFGMPSPESGREVDDATRRRLAALGYLGGGLTVGEGDVRAFVDGGEALYRLILERQVRGDLAGAEEAARQFVERHPNATVGWLAAGGVAVLREDFAAAEHRFRRAAELDPTNTQAWINLGNVYFVSGRDAAAAAAYEQVLALDPDAADALFNLGALASRARRWADAAVHWQRLLELHPEHPQARAVEKQLEILRRNGAS